MLRHACGYALANAGHDTRLIQDWLGHRAIQHTARYTELSPTRFKDVWRRADAANRLAWRDAMVVKKDPWGNTYREPPTPRRSRMSSTGALAAAQLLLRAQLV